MLHLAIIGIACAASALNESIAFIERKHNEFNTFCLSDEGKENIAKVFFPQVSPNVDVHNSSDIGGQKITNRTSSYFYDYIINRYQSTRNDSCVLAENVSLKKLKSFQSDVDVAFRKRVLLWEKKKSMSSTSEKNADYPIKSCRKKRYKVTSKRGKMRKLKGEALKNKMEFGGLNPKEKKLFLKLKNLKTSFSGYYLKDNGLDLEKRLQKFFKNMESEYQLRKSKSLETSTTISDNHKKTLKKNSKNSVSFFNNNLKHMFSLKKNSFRNKHRNIDTNSDLLSVNIVRDKNPVFGKASFIGTYDSLKTNAETLKNSKLRKNRRHLCNDFRDLKPIYRKKLIAKPYPYSNNFKSKINFLYPNNKFIFKRKKKRHLRTRSALCKSQPELKNWPYFKEFSQHHSNIYKPRRKLHEKLYDTENDPFSSNTDPQISQNADESLSCDSNFASADGISKEKSNTLKRKKKLSVPLTASGEVKEVITEAVDVLNATLKYEEDYPPDHTIEKPFLERDFQNQIHETNFNVQYDGNPIFNSNHHQSYRTHSLQTNADQLLPLSNFTKIPHGLRKCLNRHFLKNKRNKRGMKCCSPPRKCWRSAPLLCIPYIKKGQEDILKYLIQVLEKLLGKPIPPKKDIFEKTKYKPEKGPTTENTCDDMYEDDYDTEAMGLCGGSDNKPTMISGIRTTVKPSKTPVLGSNICPNNGSSNCQTTESSNSAGVYCTPQVTTVLPQTEPQSQRKGSACLQDCSCTPPSVFSNTFKTNYGTPAQLTVTPSASTTSSTKVSLFIPVSEENVTQNLKQFSNQSLLGPSSVTETPAPINSFCSSALMIPSNQLADPGFTNPDNSKSSSAFYTSSTAAEITESSTFTTAPFVSTMEINKFAKNSAKTENYFSLTPYSFTDEPDYSKVEPYQYSEVITPALLNQIKIPIPCEKKSKQIDCDSIYKNLGNIPSIFHHTQPWESVTNSIPISFDDEIFRYPFKYDTFEIDKNHNRNLGKYMKKKKGYNSDYFFDENLLHYQPMNFYVPPKKFFKKHQKKFLKQNLHVPTRLSNSADYYSNEPYPLPRSDRINKMNSKKHPKRMRKNRFRKNKYRKTKHVKNHYSVARRKREDDYIWPKIYRDYLDESVYKDKDLKEHLGNPSEISDKNSPNQSWTPPIFDMFSELAKAVSVLTITESETTKAESDTARNTAPAINATLSTITTSLPTSAATKNTALTTTCSSIITAKTTKALSSPKRAANNIISTAFPIASNYSVTTNLPVTAAANISNDGVAAVMNTTNTGLFKSKNFAKASVNQNEKMLSENEKHSAKYASNNLSLPSAENKSISPAVFSSHSFKIGVESIIGSKYTKKLIGSKSSNSKANLTESESFKEKTLKADSRKKEKNGKGNTDLDVGDRQVPTTLKMAVIVKGPKKMLTKPSPKVFSKVYPDSFDSEVEANETIATTTVTSLKPSIENKTALLSSTSKPDNRLQILAVCEGYLEIIKRLKALNQSFGENLDAELTQYCENIISQSFNTQMEKPKKIEPSEPLLNSSDLNSAEDRDNNTKVTHKANLSTDANESVKNFIGSHKNKIDYTDIDDSASEEKNKNGKVRKKHKNIKKENNLTDTDTSESPKSKAKKKKRKKKNHSSRSHVKKEKEEKNHGTDMGILKRGISEEQEKLIQLLKTRKRELVSWLMNSNDLYKKEDLPETNYLSEEDFSPPDYNYSEFSGTIKPKRDDNNSKTTHSLYNVSEGIFPIYAKRYGYSSGGELREMEILWRKINEKTHEKKILKNMSVVAYLIMSTKSPSLNEVKLQGGKEYESEYIPDPELKVGNKAVLSSETPDINDKSSPFETEKPDVTIPFSKTSNSTAKPKNNKAAILPIRNETHTFISKPELSSIVGAPSGVNKIHHNATRRASHKFGVAKDFVQEYSIEFLNYAVYILPAMFTILFFFCSFGCALYILKSRKSFKRVKKRKIRALSSDETMETSEESEDRRTKRKRENKRKKKDTALAENLEKKTRKKFWNVLKMPSSNSCKEFNESIHQSERKSFLKFLKGRKDESKGEGNKFSKKYQGSGDEGVYHSDQSATKKEMHKGDASSETVERRELISLLEELKKIELEQTGEKKEVKSVQVQYTIQEDKNPFCQRPEFSYPYEKNMFGLPKGYFFSSKKFPNQQTESNVVKDWDMYEDVSEMTELLPCDCSYFPKKNDYFRHFRLNQEGECKNIYKIYNDSSENPNKPFRGKNFMVNESENQSLICNKFRSVNLDTSDEFMGVKKKSVGTEVRLTDDISPFRLLFKKNTNSVEEMKDMKHPQSKKKYVRLKDDGVLCKL